MRRAQWWCADQQWILMQLVGLQLGRVLRLMELAVPSMLAPLWKVTCLALMVRLAPLRLRLSPLPAELRPYQRQH